ncbi:MAG TPA: alpha-glucuronidase family glycosyl hydrolase, partial [Vicinamibacteria bacterium]
MRSLGVLALVLAASAARAEDGYELWLRYRPLSDARALERARAAAAELVIPAGSPVQRAARDELRRGLRGLLDRDVPLADAVSRHGAIVAGTPSRSSAIAALDIGTDLGRAGQEGFLIRSTRVAGKRATVIAANTDVGVLYGAFRLLRLLQTGHAMDGLSIIDAPRVKRRLLNHWDNLDRTVERGYAGFSLWDWHKLPDHLDPRTTDYARANASIGINGTVLTNVNANATSLTAEWLAKAAA